MITIKWTFDRYWLMALWISSLMSLTPITWGVCMTMRGFHLLKLDVNSSDLVLLLMWTQGSLNTTSSSLFPQGAFCGHQGLKYCFNGGRLPFLLLRSLLESSSVSGSFVGHAFLLVAQGVYVPVGSSSHWSHTFIWWLLDTLFLPCSETQLLIPCIM